jgi:hypothetical protein
MVSQEFQGEFVRDNVVENLNIIFSQHEWLGALEFPSDLFHVTRHKVIQEFPSDNY